MHILPPHPHPHPSPPHTSDQPSWLDVPGQNTPGFGQSPVVQRTSIPGIIISSSSVPPTPQIKRKSKQIHK